MRIQHKFALYLLVLLTLSFTLTCFLAGRVGWISSCGRDPDANRGDTLHRGWIVRVARSADVQLIYGEFTHSGSGAEEDEELTGETVSHRERRREKQLMN